MLPHIGHDTYNHKKILCKNITTTGKCLYMYKCLFAHCLDEQKIDNKRAPAYEIIKNNNDLSHIDLTKNSNLYNNLVILTNLCLNCENNICTGGYNCKYGACKKAYVVCIIDLNKGTCNNKCDKIHLTKRGLKPYGTCLINKLNAQTIPDAIHINNNYFEKICNTTEQNDEIMHKNDEPNNESWCDLLELITLNREQNNTPSTIKIDKSIFDI